MPELSLVTLNLELAVASLLDCERYLEELQEHLENLSNNIQELKEVLSNG